MAEVRSQFPSWVIAGGIDEVNYRKLTPEELRRQMAGDVVKWAAVIKRAGIPQE